ncbi:DNA-3-methyladenine glycosylase family protein [Sporomusa malonica]|uniref:DNA-3-methyladenine glycosylase II n=1 Tax=Sporomusa malonica TaxID=112901 RepID=A0A1W2E6S5_9FIRM|nr:DNA-3-methyladenine glycosylase [Sporomusa malonica]SMD05490.1 DNA-3-methyladenine glycosylase II [Sporomusa malonica]
MPSFTYGQVEIEYLKRKDKKLGVAIDQIGMIEREVNPDVFSALVGSVLSQQISTKAAQTVRQRMNTLLDGDITPQGIAGAGAEAIKGCGMSTRKAGYIMGLAEAALTGVVDFGALHTLPDAQIINNLTALSGVGVWTAEMLLIFSLCRPDVVSYGDLAIRRGMLNLYGLRELTKDKFEKYRKRYSPYGSVASLYLWAISVDNGMQNTAIARNKKS